MTDSPVDSPGPPSPPVRVYPPPPGPMDVVRASMAAVEEIMAILRDPGLDSAARTAALCALRDARAAR